MSSAALQVTVLVGLLLPAPAIPGRCSERPALEITHVQIIDVTTGAVRPNATITIDSGRICRITSGETPPSAAKQKIDGRGRFALPGFFANPTRQTAPERATGYGITNVTPGALPRDVPAPHLHDELGRLVGQGQTPLQALQAVTITAAQRLQLNDAGRLSEGFVANLVLLEDDPLHDVNNARRISLVVQNGQALGLVDLARARAGRRARQPFAH